MTSSDVDARRRPDEPEKPTGQDGAANTTNAVKQGEKVVELQRKVIQLEKAVESHATVDQAIGIVVALGKLTPDQAWTVLRETSQHTNMKLSRVADLVVAWGCAGELPDNVRRALDASLARARATSECTGPTA
ncbi:ANTAR domain-containing protein [Streptomyces sp. NPDC018584]|uniref:ANTAR domain-containing protein n=1 Tax=unclassified Streptomyces TaxID=2593676 RepID=UPI003799C4CD